MDDTQNACGHLRYGKWIRKYTGRFWQDSGKVFCDECHIKKESPDSKPK
jgi:hypothetical protein